MAIFSRMGAARGKLGRIFQRRAGEVGAWRAEWLLNVEVSYVVFDGDADIYRVGMQPLQCRVDDP